MAIFVLVIPCVARIERAYPIDPSHKPLSFDDTVTRRLTKGFSNIEIHNLGLKFLLVLQFLEIINIVDPDARAADFGIG